MPLDKHGSKPEVQDFGSDEWVAQNYTAREVEHLPGRANNWRPKKKIGLPDQREVSEAYREGWDRIFGKKESAP